MALPFGPSDGKEIPEEIGIISKSALQICQDLATIPNFSIEKMEAIFSLDGEQIVALGEDVLASEFMIPDKIQVIAFELTVDDILLITPGILETITEDELRYIIENRPRMQYRKADGTLKEVATLSGPFSDDFHIKERVLGILET